MGKISKLVVGTDLSDNARAAAHWAHQFGDSTDCEVIVCYVTEINVANWASGAYDLLEDDQLRAKAERRVREWYEEATGVEPDGVDVRVGTAQVQMAEATHDLDADCLVVARSGKSSWEKFWLGSTAKALANDPPCNLIIVHPEHEKPDVGEIAIGTDFSKSADRALVFAADLARRFGAKLDIVYSDEEPAVEIFEPEEVPDEYLRGDVYLEGPAKMDDLVERHAKELEGIDYETHIVKDAPAKGLIEFIDSHGIDTVVVGRSGHSPFVASMLGSVLNKLVQSVPATIAIAPSAVE